jgi:small subunit ribosomal protein S19
MSRSLKKGYYVNEKLLKKVMQLKELSPEERAKRSIKTWSRDSTIIPEMIGMIFEVHNGKQFIKIKIVEDMVGHRLGEFAPTRKFVRHGGRAAELMMKKQQTK